MVLGEGILWGIIVPLMEDNEGIWIPATALRDALWVCHPGLSGKSGMGYSPAKVYVGKFISSTTEKRVHLETV